MEGGASINQNSAAFDLNRGNDQESALQNSVETKNATHQIPGDLKALPSRTAPATALGLKPKGAAPAAAEPSPIAWLPREVMQLIFDLLPPSAILRFGATSREIRNELGPRINLLTARGRSRHVATLEAFHSMLDDEALGRPLPAAGREIPACRGEVLATLGSRIAALPEGEQEQARVDFIGVAEMYRGPKPANFDDALMSARKGTGYLREQAFHNACRACSTPNEVECIAHEKGITGDEQIADMMRLAAEGEIMRHRNVKDAAQAFGISDEKEIIQLQHFALNCSHIRDALGMRAVSDLARQYGIDDPEVIAGMSFWALHNTAIG